MYILIYILLYILLYTHTLYTGNPIYRKEDLIKELSDELIYINNIIQLSYIDQELHDAYATRNESVEVKCIVVIFYVCYTSHVLQYIPYYMHL